MCSIVAIYAPRSKLHAAGCGVATVAMLDRGAAADITTPLQQVLLHIPVIVMQQYFARNGTGRDSGLPGMDWEETLC